MYLNTSTGYVYRCTVAGNASVAKWAYVGSIKGATGASGATAAAFTGATANAAGKAGLVPAPAKGTQGAFLKGDATWETGYIVKSDAKGYYIEV